MHLHIEQRFFVLLYLFTLTLFLVVFVFLFFPQCIFVEFNFPVEALFYIICDGWGHGKECARFDRQDRKRVQNNVQPVLVSRSGAGVNDTTDRKLMFGKTNGQYQLSGWLYEMTIVES